MKLESFISVLKEFFLEILGFLIPGYLFLLILMGYGTINYDFLNDFISLLNNKPEVTLLLAYIMGYVIYPIHIVGDWFRKWLSAKWKCFNTISDETLIANINNSKELTVVKSKLTNLIREDFSNSTYREVRNLAMSYLPNESPKIYTFMFRSDLCKSISSVVFWTITPIVIYHSYYNVCWKYLCLIPNIILFCYLLQITRYRFLGIAYRIPFSMFIAKCHPLES